MKRFFPLVVALAIVLMSTAAFAGEWTGMIMKKDGQTWLKVGENTFSVTNPEKAEAFMDQNVKVMGTADEAAKTVTIDSVSAAS